MPIELDKLATVKQHLRRKFSLSQLKQQADAIFDLATEEVTITSTGFEGGTTAGQISFPKILMLQALEELIAEKDPVNTPKAPGGSVHPDFSQRCITT